MTNFMWRYAGIVGMMLGLCLWTVWVEASTACPHGIILVDSEAGVQVIGLVPTRNAELLSAPVISYHDVTPLVESVAGVQSAAALRGQLATNRELQTKIHAVACALEDPVAFLESYPQIRLKTAKADDVREFQPSGQRYSSGTRGMSRNERAVLVRSSIADATALNGEDLPGVVAGWVVERKMLVPVMELESTELQTTLAALRAGDQTLRRVGLSLAPGDLLSF